MDLFPSILLVTLLLTINSNLLDAKCKRPHQRPNVIATYPNGKTKSKIFEDREMIEFSCKLGFKNVGGDSLIICIDSEWSVIGSTKIRPYKPYRCVEKDCLVRKPTNGHVEVKGKKVSFRCNEGFRIVGIAKSMCKLNEDKEYHLKTRPPVCKKRPQCKILDDKFLRYKGSNYDGDTVKFSCVEGYELIGSNSLKCDSTGKWKGIFPHCKRIPKCVDPGISENSERKGNCCQEGTSWTYTCHEGNEMLDGKTKKTITCLSSQTWSEPKPICKPVDLKVCPPPPKKNNLVVEFAERTHSEIFLSGDEVDFACLENYTSSGSSLSLMCQNDGTWDGDFAVCSPLNPCDRPRIPQNGRIIELENNDAKFFPIGFEINLKCDENYEVRSGLYGTKCAGDKWEDELENCTRIWCNDPGIPKNGVRSGDSFYVGDEVTFSCSSNYRLIGSAVRECLPNGRWNGIITVCDNGESDCVDPGFPLNSYRQGDKFNTGNVVIYSCKQGFSLFGNATRECLENGFWSGEQIECYGKNEFSDEDDVINSLDETLTIAARSAAGSELHNSLTRSGISVINEDEAAGLTMYFIMDVSKSINDLHFHESKKFIKLIIQKIGLTGGPYGVRSSVVFFSSNVSIVVSPFVKEIEVALHQIDNANRNALGTNIVAALNKLRDLISAQVTNDPGRANARSIAFLISDGIVTEGGNPVDTVKSLKHSFNVEFYVIAIGTKQNKEILSTMSNHLLMFSKYEDLIKAVDKAVGKKIDYSPCGLEQPDYNAEIETTNEKKQKSGKSRKKRSMSSLMRIIGGDLADRPWPWMAGFNFTPSTDDDKSKAKRLRKYIGHNCGGFIIHYNWIVSAAHCFHDKNEETYELIKKVDIWRVIVGRTKQSTVDGLELRIEKIIIHPNYDPDTQDYDIALVKPVNAIPFDHFIRPVCLPPIFDEAVKNSQLYREKQIAVVAGWGHSTSITANDTSTRPVEHLLQVEVPIQNEAICHKRVNYTVCSHGRCVDYSIVPSDRMFCAGSEKGGIDSCKGDSGGPIMQQVSTVNEKHKVTRWFAVGAVSGGVGCGIKGFLGYYAHISKLRTWIESTCQVEFENIKLD